MEENTQDTILRAYTNLMSLRTTLESIKKEKVEEKYVIEYHIALDKLNKLGFNISEYYIASSEVKPIVTSIRTLSFSNEPAGPKYSKEKYVDKDFLLMKLNSIIGYFEITNSKQEKHIGFNTTKKQ